MRLRLPVLVSYISILYLMLVLQPASAQNKFEQINYKIDSLTDIGLPKSALKEVDKLEELARKNNVPSQQIRAVIFRMTLQSYIAGNHFPQKRKNLEI